jgi:hypothetical protein
VGLEQWAALIDPGQSRQQFGPVRVPAASLPAAVISGGYPNPPVPASSNAPRSDPAIPSHQCRRSGSPPIRTSPGQVLAPLPRSSIRRMRPGRQRWTSARPPATKLRQAAPLAAWLIQHRYCLRRGYRYQVGQHSCWQGGASEPSRASVRPVVKSRSRSRPVGERARRHLWPGAYGQLAETAARWR